MVGWGVGLTLMESHLEEVEVCDTGLDDDEVVWCEWCEVCGALCGAGADCRLHASVDDTDAAAAAAAAAEEAAEVEELRSFTFTFFGLVDLVVNHFLYGGGDGYM